LYIYLYFYTFVYNYTFNITINNGKITLLNDEYIYSYVNEF